jgi:signal transduction histidine kinase
MQKPIPRSVDTDSTEPAQFEYLEASGFDRAKKSFLAAMSHELRTPLNAIIGFSEIMDAEMFGPIAITQYQGYIRDILASGQHLLSIINDVLEISRAETGELVLNKRELDLRVLIAEEQATFDEECRAKGSTIVTDLPDDLIIRVDPAKIRRVIKALLSNAVKFGDEGTKIRIVARLDDQGEVTIRIQDQGIGIAPSEIERVFVPFVQLDDSLSRRFEGSGLGLPLARILTELHGGVITLDSLPGIGTTAIVTLPAYAGALAGRRGQIAP